MKKSKVSVLVAVMAVLVLSACGSKSTETETQAPSETTSVTEDTSVSAEVTLSAEDKSKIQTLVDAIDFRTDASLADKIDSYDDISAKTDGKSITYKDSLTKSFYEKMLAAESFYSVIKEPTGCMRLASDGNNCNVTVLGDDSQAIMIIRDKVAHSFDPLKMTGYTITLDDETMKQFEKTALVNTVMIVPSDDTQELKSYTVNVDGKDYTYEVFNGYGYVFDGDGQLIMRNDTSGNYPVDFRINEMPDGVFADPEGYTVADYDSLISQAQSSSEAAATSASDESASETTSVS